MVSEPSTLAATITTHGCKPTSSRYYFHRSSSTPSQNVYPMYDPFYLHGSEQPGLQLVAEKLTPTNYIDWSKAFHNTLGAKNKLGFVDGSIPDPCQGHANAWSWTRNNIMVLSWI
ncbi:unnamed protein product [Linum trigynum]|uniref:Retrotransposon Copia-like N-terminal domain-containing protein n=1 Tax=Linum trigynum TaxID=586398 RepID=A0AAV2E4X0_9ROSI